MCYPHRGNIMREVAGGAARHVGTSPSRSSRCARPLIDNRDIKMTGIQEPRLKCKRRKDRCWVLGARGWGAQGQWRVASGEWREKSRGWGLKGSGEWQGASGERKERGLGTGC